MCYVALVPFQFCAMASAVIAEAAFLTSSRRSGGTRSRRFVSLCGGLAGLLGDEPKSFFQKLMVLLCCCLVRCCVRGETPPPKLLSDGEAWRRKLDIAVILVSRRGNVLSACVGQSGYRNLPLNAEAFLGEDRDTRTGGRSHGYCMMTFHIGRQEDVVSGLHQPCRS